MKIENWDIGKVKPYKNNPRNNDDAVEATANSIKEFGWQQPIVVDKDGVIIVGHTRLKAAKKLKLEQVPVTVAENLTDDQVKAFRLADNKTGELVGWDFLERLYSNRQDGEQVKAFVEWLGGSRTIGFRDDYIYRFISNGRTDKNILDLEQRDRNITQESFIDFKDDLNSTIY